MPRASIVGNARSIAGSSMPIWGWRLLRKVQLNSRNGKTPSAEQPQRLPQPTLMQGKKLFLDHCAGCHTIRGTEAVGAHAPDLTHLKSRRLIAAGLLTNTPDHLVQWITHAQELKPGARMPSMVLTATEITALSAFLSTLN